MLRKYIILYIMSISPTFAAVFPNQDFVKCQKNYDEKIGEVVATGSLPAIDTVWRILFDDFDENKDYRVCASEFIVKLNEENLISMPESESNELFNQVQAWIDSAYSQDGDAALTFNEFKNVVRNSIGRIENDRHSRQQWLDVLSAVCEYIANRMPYIISSIQDLRNCTESLKREQLKTMAAQSDRMIVNTWKSVYSTLDEDKDGMVTTTEITDTLSTYNPGAIISKDNVKSDLNSFFGQEKLTESNFLFCITSIFVASQDDTIWKNVSSQSELNGKILFCEVLYETRNDFNTRLNENKRCISLYKKTKKYVFNNDSSVASAYLFAVMDQNKDGVITSDVMKSLLCPSQHQNELNDVSCNSLFSLGSFEKILPDHVVDAKENSHDDVFELSSLSCGLQKIWNAFCLTLIEELGNFPTSVIAHVDQDDDPVDDLYDASDDALIEELRRRLIAMEISDQTEILRAFLTLIESLPTPTDITGRLQSELESIKTENGNKNLVVSTNSELEVSQVTSQSPLDTSPEKGSVLQLSDGIMHDSKNNNKKYEKELKMLLEYLNVTMVTPELINDVRGLLNQNDQIQYPDDEATSSVLSSTSKSRKSAEEARLERLMKEAIQEELIYN